MNHLLPCGTAKVIEAYDVVTVRRSFITRVRGVCRMLTMPRPVSVQFLRMSRENNCNLNLRASIPSEPYPQTSSSHSGRCLQSYS